jgi:hypothetical protein
MERCKETILKLIERLRMNTALPNKISEHNISTLCSGNYLNGHGPQAGFDFHGDHWDLTTSSWMFLWPE